MDATTWGWLALAALCIGVSKTGFSGISLISVFILAEIYGAKASIGFALPLLIIADLMVYSTFRSYGKWKQVWVLLPPTFVGMAIAFWVLSEVSNSTMKQIIGIVILSMVGLQILKMIYQEQIEKLAMSKGFGWVAASSGGVATVLANAAGPILQLFLISRRMEKMELIGVGVKFFLLVNFIKLPFNAQLDLVTWETLKMNLMLIPAIALGVFGGKKLITKVPQKLFEWLVIGFALVAGLRLIWG